MSPFIDDRGRLFGRVNILDILVLLLIAALAVFALTRLSDPQAADHGIRVTLVSEKGVRQPTIGGVKVGQTVRDDNGNVLGKVESATVEPTLEEGFTAKGLETAKSKVYSDLTIVVVGRAQGSKSTPRIGNTPLRTGRFLQAIGPTWEVKVQINEVEVLEP